jgi:hypothetical protein
LDGKFACFGVKIRKNVTVKYATTTKAAWNVKFVGLADTIFRKTKEKIVAEILRK